MPGDQNSENETALGHLRVIELGDIPASYATRWLGDLGVDVIKVEPPGGDPNRLLPPFAGNFERVERSLAFIHANTSKRSIVLDLENSFEREIFSRLLGTADLLVEATPVGYLKKLEFTGQRFQESFPRLVVVSLTPFGRTGPYRNYKGSDAIANATGGFLYGQGDNKKGQCTGLPGIPSLSAASADRPARPGSAPTTITSLVNYWGLAANASKSCRKPKRSSSSRQVR